MTVVDLFAGPGGWDQGARDLGLDPLGIELDPRACETRRAAGHRTLEADVTALDPLDFAPVTGLIASPPCTAFSNAGDRAGLHDVPLIFDCVKALARGEDPRAEVRARCADPSSLLVVEPLRWALALEPDWIALEQVPPVLDLWRLIADVLRDRGWSTWAGVLNSADYGVPQIRRRAILLASRTKTALPPEPTHAAPGEGLSLFAELAPWVTMAEALGWGMTARPGFTIASGAEPGTRGASSGGLGGSGARRGLRAEQEAGRWHVGFPRRADTPSNEAGDRIVVAEDGTEYRERDLFPDDGPAQTVTEKVRSWRRWIVDTGNTRSGDRDEGRKAPTDAPAPTITSRADQLEWREDEPDTAPREQRMLNPGKTDSQPNRRLYDADAEPAPTVAFGHDAAGWAWERPAPTVVGTRRSDEGGLVGRQLPEGEGRNVGGRDWPHERPATTVQGDAHIADPGYRGGRADYDRGSVPRQFGGEAEVPEDPDRPRLPVAVNTGRDWKEGGARDDAQVVSVDQPAPTVDGKGRWHKLFADGDGNGREREPRDPDWPTKRPSTTVAGDPRIAQPGHKNDADSPDSPGRMEGAIRVTLDEAAVLQGFPRGYPWQGNNTERFRQVGNAVPPPLARAVLEVLTSPLT